MNTYPINEHISNKWTHIKHYSHISTDRWMDDKCGVSYLEYLIYFEPASVIDSKYTETRKCVIDSLIVNKTCTLAFTSMVVVFIALLLHSVCKLHITSFSICIEYYIHFYIICYRKIYFWSFDFKTLLSTINLIYCMHVYIYIVNIYSDRVPNEVFVLQCF